MGAGAAEGGKRRQRGRGEVGRIRVLPADRPPHSPSVSASLGAGSAGLWRPHLTGAASAPVVSFFLGTLE